MRRTAQEGVFKVTVRGIPLTLYAGSVGSTLSEPALFFFLLGEVHKEPLRFLDIDEIHSVMGNVFGRLGDQDKKRFQLDGLEWSKMRAENASSAIRACFEAESTVTLSKAALRAAKSAAHTRGVDAARKFAQAKVTAAVVSMMPLIGRNQVAKMAELMNFAVPVQHGPPLMAEIGLPSPPHGTIQPGPAL